MERRYGPLIENATALVRVIDYIHLNPVRAKIVALEQSASFRWSSLRRFVQGRWPDWLCGDRLLAQLGLENSAEGWSRYLEHLSDVVAGQTQNKETQSRELCAGWAIGTAAWKRAIARDYAHLATLPDIDASEIHEIKEQCWHQTLDAQLRDAGRSHQEVDHDPVDAPWKIEIAARLRQSAVPYRWIAENA